MRREVEVLNLVSDHGNVAALQATYEDAQHVHLVLELCRGGELFDRIISKGTFTEKTAAGGSLLRLMELSSHLKDEHTCLCCRTLALWPLANKLTETAKVTA